MTTAIVDREFLRNLAGVLDRAFDDDWTAPAHLVKVDHCDGEAFDLGLLAVGGHPVDHLRGLVAPDDCLVIGAVVHGWASKPGWKSRRRVRVVTLVARGGMVQSLVRQRGKDAVDLGPPEGAVVEALRAVFPISPAPAA